MAERSSKRKKKDHDFATVAWRVVQQAVGEAPEVEPEEQEPTPEERHAAAAVLGRLGGKKGGKARAAKLAPEQRSAIAKKAAQAAIAQTRVGIILCIFSVDITAALV